MWGGAAESGGRVLRPSHLIVLGAALLGLTLPGVASAELAISLTPSTTQPYYVCPQGACQAIIDPPPLRRSRGYALASGPLLEGSGAYGGYDPADIRSAYKIPRTGGASQTVAIVDAWGYGTAERDLGVYRRQYNLPECTSANGCLRIVNQEGQESPLPPLGSGVGAAWSLEQALDLDMASAACPECHILLVQASSEHIADLAAAANEATNLGATEISNSYGVSETSSECGATGCLQYQADYHHPGTLVVAGSGDSGYGKGPGGLAGIAAANFPAASPSVLAVGGTSLRRAVSMRHWSEAVWHEGRSGTGSGCSLFERKPVWQTDPGCALRTTNDVAAVAACETPVSVRISELPLGKLGMGKWANMCGTSASGPLLAGILAHSDSYTRSLGAEAFYLKPGLLFDVTSGKNGECPSIFEYLCTAEIGYDGPTGWGTPRGVPRVKEP